MYTVCTNCKTKFRVSSAQLKAAEGKVRCGKCHQVFDAFWALEGNNSDPQLVPVQEEPATRPNLDSVSSTAAPPPELDTIIRAKPARKEQDTERKAPELPITPLTDYPLADTPSMKAGPRQ
ncbi:MAG TPA: MJ0042-type zinc finger domain-containing protein, partial [Gammaproteobacteria bacterium]|nr:MJ0042-type zinc finger domain-containing protein [Gammaproteobacteria bacterium]